MKVQGDLEISGAANVYVEIVNLTANTTLGSEHGNSLVIMNSTSARVITLPSSVAIGFQVALARKGSGTLTFAPPAGQTITELNSLNGVKLKGIVTVIKVSSTEWWAQGATE